MVLASGKWKERCTVVHAVPFFSHSPSLWNQPKRYSVLKVLSFYSSAGSEKWKWQDYLRAAIFSSPCLQARSLQNGGFDKKEDKGTS
jgi:hypothetical protein